MDPQDNPTVIIYALIIRSGEKVPIQALVTDNILKVKMKLYIEKDIPIDNFTFMYLGK